MCTWSVDYRMPPDHPYPASLDDCVTVYRRLLDVRSPEQIVVGGASAGGNLTATLMLRPRDEGLPMPAALVLQTPEVDLTESGDSFVTNLGLDNVLTASLAGSIALYAGDHDLTGPVSFAAVRRRHRVPTDAAASGNPGPLPVQHGAYAPEAPGSRDRCRAARVRSDAARRLLRRTGRRRAGSREIRHFIASHLAGPR